MNASPTANELTGDAAPSVSFVVLGPSKLGDSGQPLKVHDEELRYYAASTIKLAVAAALLFAVESGEISLAQTVPSRQAFSSRIAGAPSFTFGADEVDPGMPPAGNPMRLDTCLDRMLTVSSNEATNLLIELLGLAAVETACNRLGVPDIRVTRLIGDYAAREAGFTHAASALDLARLMWAVTEGNQLTKASRGIMLDTLSRQRFPIIAEALRPGTTWASKSGWVTGIRHDVAAIGEPGSDDFRVLAVCTAGFEANGAQQLINALSFALIA